MPITPTNILQQVQTYQRSSLARLLNLCCFVSTANTRFKDFDRIATNLGSVVTFDLPPLATTVNSLVWSSQAAVQRVVTLACNQQGSSSFDVNAQQRIFNLEKGEDDYMRVFGASAITALANIIEKDVALNVISGVVDGSSGNLITDSGPYRFFGNGSTAINSYQQLAQAVMFFKNPGMVTHDFKFYLPDTIIPSIVGGGLNQFAPHRNDDIAMSWEIGDFGSPVVNYYQSNLLPIQVCGNTGVNAQTLTIVSTNDPTGQNVTQLTVSGATANDANAIFSGDVFQFADGVTGKPNMRYLTTYAYSQSASPVQIRATAQAGANGSGNVTFNIFPALNWAGGQNLNLNNAISAGMQLTTFPSHRGGMILGGDAMYISMPQLPEMQPYDTANEYDPNTGVSVRLTYGSVIGQNQTKMGYDAIWGSVVVPSYSMRLLVPLSQG